MVIAPSFADIFGNFNNPKAAAGDAEQVDELFALVQANPGISFEVDLEAGKPVTRPTASALMRSVATAC
ncbi:hypothetical protein [Enterobacter hormaechei]|uniref:hypothetical protein n=1 Tax=Enterobacter hormaechei TaxID=158836 RepID=UPI003D669D6D